MPGHKTYFNWSSGKDSALALYHLLQDGDYDVEYLLTSVNGHYGRVSMHGLRIELLMQQIIEIGIPSGTVKLPEMPSNSDYEKLLGEKVDQLRSSGFEYAAFGDIFLEDLRKYREHQLSALNIKALFPLWKRDTRELIEEFIARGFKAITVCVNADLLDQSQVGRIIDMDFIKELPEKVDPCGENGEFHTFCFEGPIFKKPIRFSIGEKIKRDYPGNPTSSFWFCDLLPDNEHVPA